MMRVMGSALQILGFATGLGGVLLGIVSIRYGGLAVAVGSVLGGILIMAIGMSVHALSDIAKDTKRSADALDRLAQARTGVASQLPPAVAKRLKEISKQ